jgi:hypothetical protein
MSTHADRLSREWICVVLACCGAMVQAGCSHPATSEGAGAATAKPVAIQRLSADAASPEPPAMEQFDSWLAAFNSGDRAAMAAYHQQHFPYSAAPVGIGDADHEAMASGETGGFEVKKTEIRGSTTLVAILKWRRSDRFARAVMEVDPGPSHSVVRFEINPIPTPDEFLSTEERAAIQLDAARRAALIDGIADAIKRHYVLPDIGVKMIASLRDHASHGDYESITDGRAFVERVTNDLRDVSHDGHLECVFGRKPPPPTEQPPGEHLAYLRSVHFGFGPIERLSGNIALMAIDGFVSPPDDDVQAAIGGFMTQIADADALVLDLRHNEGGDPHTVAVVASYLFDGKPVHLNDIVVPERGKTEQFWTLRDVKGTRFGAQKPVYVLTSRETFSGGEELAYDLKALKRALIIGETTGGGAHPANLFDLDDWYHVVVPNGRPVNPITKTDWEGVGVVPDVPVAADAALDEAVRRATKDIAQQRPRKPQ